MRTTLTLVAAALLVLAGCSSEPGGPDYEALIGQVESAGQESRECERAPRSADCRFAIRDGADTMTDVWKSLADHELQETEQAKDVHAVGYAWSQWRIRCDVETPNEHAYWCVTNAPSESDVSPAVAALRDLRDL